MKSSIKFPSGGAFAYNIQNNEESRKDKEYKETMTNHQQNSLAHTASLEPHISPHQQENIQLTELRPVEQSRIKDNPGDKDHETTDGLKALRSFSSGEIERFEPQRELECFRKIIVPAIEVTDCLDNRISESRKRKNNLKSGIEVEDAIIEGFDSNCSSSDGKICSLKKKKRRKFIDVEIDSSTGEVKENGKEAVNKTRLKSIRDEIEDEVYDFRQQLPDPNDPDRSSSDEIWNMNLEVLSAGVYRDMANNFSGTAEDSPKATSCKKRKKIQQAEKKKINEKNGKKLRSLREKVRVKRKTNVSMDASDKSQAEKDLRLKVDGIIQANFYLERENNNVVHGQKKNTSKSVETLAPESTKKAKKVIIAPEDLETETKEDLNQDKSTIDTKKYNCVMCSSKFKGSGGLRNHYKVMHAAGPLYKCDECGKEFPLKERLKLHVRTHTGFKPYKCPDCPKSFARGGQLAQHRGTHTKVKPYCCNLCKGTFTCAANLALHIKRHNGQKDHKCEICGRGFVRKDALKKHLECLHRDVKSFLCVICNKTFKGHLPQHMRTHAQDRPHGCATCGQRFAQKSQLTVHQRTHSGQRPFRCLVCWQAFAHSTALKLHTRRHTGERPFKCVECNAGFTQLPHWKKHMKCIHGRTEPYSCKICHSFFRIKNDLESHEKECHITDVLDDLAKTTNDISDCLNVKKSVPPNLDPSKFRAMSVERMRLLLAVLLKRISKPQRLDELGFGKRLIDEVLQDSLISAGKDPSRIGELNVLESLRKNLEIFLEWTVPKEHWDRFRNMKKTPEEILETLTAT